MEEGFKRFGEPDSMVLAMLHAQSKAGHNTKTEALRLRCLEIYATDPTTCDPAALTPAGG